MIICDDCGSQNIAGTDNCENCGGTLYHLSTPQPTDELMKRILEGSINDIKPREIIQVPVDTPVSDVIAQMREKKVGCALAMQGEKIVGIMTERDLLFLVAGKKDPAKVKIKDVMHAEPVCLKADDPVNYAFHHMTVGGYRHLPIYREDGSVAMVSARDLLRYLSK